VPPLFTICSSRLYRGRIRPVGTVFYRRYRRHRRQSFVFSGLANFVPSRTVANLRGKRRYHLFFNDLIVGVPSAVRAR
jgi:hypothetical protein